MTPPRVIVVPRAFGKTCAIRVDTYRCCLDITRMIETWNERRQIWVPQIRLCHLHAIEYLTGKPVYLPTFAQQQVIMLELGA